MGGIGVSGGGSVPMPPMIPMRFGGLAEREGGAAPFAGHVLTGQHKARYPRACDAFEMGGEILPPAPLGVEQVFDIIMQLAGREGR